MYSFKLGTLWEPCIETLNPTCNRSCLKQFQQHQFLTYPLQAARSIAGVCVKRWNWESWKVCMIYFFQACTICLVECNWCLCCLNKFFYEWMALSKSKRSATTKGCMSGNLSEHSCLFCWVGIGKLRAQRPRDVWLVLEPSFLKNHPELQDLSACLEKPTAAILSTNGDWMLSYVKSHLPQVTHPSMSSYFFCT
jgi:hypothetical protein